MGRLELLKRELQVGVDYMLECSEVSDEARAYALACFDAHKPFWHERIESEEREAKASAMSMAVAWAETFDHFKEALAAAESQQAADPPLPGVQLNVDGSTASADSGADAPTPWRIYAEWYDQYTARTQVYVAGERVADITVHRPHNGKLIDEVQEITAALLWSALRAIATKEV